MLAVSFTHALIHGTELTFAAVLLRIEDDFGSDLFLLGILANVAAFAYGFGALPSGWLVDRFGTVPILRLSLGTTCVGAALVAVAPNEAVLGVFLALLGLATGFYHPAGIALLARTRRSARNMGIHGAIGNLGIAGAPAVAAAMAVAIDWRAAFLLLAGLAAAGFLGSLRLDRRGPRPVEREELLASGERRQAPELRLRLLLLVYGAFILSGLVYRGSLTFLPAHVEEVTTLSFFGWDPAAVAGSLTTLALLSGALGWYFGGHAAERFPREFLVLILSLGLVPILLLISVAENVALLGAITVFVIFNFGAAPAFVTLVADYTPPGRLGASYGVSFFLSFGIGSFAATFAGFFADRWGTDSVFVVLAAVAGLWALLALTLVIQTRRTLGARAGVVP